MLLYRHQKSSTELKVCTLRSVWPQVVWFCFPLGLSNHRVQLCSSRCFFEKSICRMLSSPSSTSAPCVPPAVSLPRCEWVV